MLRAALVLATTASAAIASAPAGEAPRGPTSGFGRPVAVHLPHVGHIETDLGTAGPAGLVRVQCAGPASPTTACFVSR
jgi:hypothetical protein